MKGSRSPDCEGDVMTENPKPFFNIKFCPFCGSDLATCSDPWPEKTCRACERVLYHPVNSVTALVIFVEKTGIVFIKRGIKPQIGGKALPGGYQVFGESWQEAGRRETDEEVNIKIDAKNIALLDVFTNQDGHNIHFGVAHVRPQAVGKFIPSREVTERMIIPHHGVDLCFSSHRDALAKAIHTYGPEGRQILYT